jgi:hypothetical protein
VTARRGALSSILAAVVIVTAAAGAAAQAVRAHMEACTRWNTAGSQHGTYNSCDTPIVILFMAFADAGAIEREVPPGAWFGSGSDLSAGWMFTACPVGYAPNLRFARENKDAIMDSLYNCLPSRPGA